MTIQEYRDHPALNYSTLKNLLRGDDYFLKMIGQEVTVTESMRLGSLVHTLTLQPDLFEEQYLVVPEKVDMRTKLGKDLRAAAGDKTVVSKAQVEAAKIMRGNLCNLSHLSQLASSSQVLVEHPIIHTLEGIECKGLLDVHIELGSEVFIGDIKTTHFRTFSDFADAFEKGYFLQAGMYTMLKEATYPRLANYTFIFFVVSTEEPYIAFEVVLSKESLTRTKERTLGYIRKARDLMNGALKPIQTYTI
jgi:PDDEXK-like domain of unknown function (DUF3799)